MLKAEWRARKSCLWNKILGTAQNQRQLTSSSARPGIPEHILAFLFLILPWRPLAFVQTSSFCAEKQARFSSMLILISARCVATEHTATGWDEHPKTWVRAKEFRLRLLTRTAGTLAVSRPCYLIRHEAVRRIEGVCAQVHMNFNPCEHTTHMHDACMPHTIRLTRYDN